MREKTKAVILAGGLGLRIREVVKDVPKPMAMVGGRPFLEYLIIQLRQWDIRDIVITTGYKGELIKDFFKSGEKWSVNILYSEEREPLGTGGAIKEACKAVQDDSFFVMNGDSYFDADFKLLLRFHREKGAKVTMGLVSVNDTARYGRVETDDDGKIKKFAEKGRGGPGVINSGIYVIEREVFRRFPQERFSLESDVLPLFIDSGLYGIAGKGFFVDIGVPDDYMKTCKESVRLTKAHRG